MTEGALQAAVTVLPIALRRSWRPRDGAPIREAVRVRAVSSDRCVVGASETDVAVPLNLPRRLCRRVRRHFSPPHQAGRQLPQLIRHHRVLFGHGPGGVLTL